MKSLFKCEFCSSEDDSVFVCKNCFKLRLSLPEYNFYTALGMPVIFAPDEKILESKYETLMGLIHPDLFVNTTPTEQQASIKYSAILKEAKDVLSLPISSAFYILKIFGKSYTKANIQPDQNFLQEVFLLNEEFNEQPADNEFVQKITTMYDQRLLSLKKLFDDFFKTPDAIIAQLYRQLGQFKFISNLYYKATGNPEHAHF